MKITNQGLLYFTPEDVLDILVSWERSQKKEEFPIPFTKSTPYEFAKRINMDGAFRDAMQKLNTGNGKPTYSRTQLDTVSIREAERMIDDSSTSRVPTYRRSTNTRSQEPIRPRLTATASHQLSSRYSDWLATRRYITDPQEA